MSKVTLLSRIDTRVQVIYLPVRYPSSLYYTSQMPAHGHNAPQMILCLFYHFISTAGTNNAVKLMIVSVFSAPLFKLLYAPRISK